MADGTATPALEQLIQQRLRRETSVRPAIGRADRGQPHLPLSAGQLQMWALHQLDPMSPAYLMSWMLRLSGRLDAEALRRAWQQVVERHEILRTRYFQHGDEPGQVIDPPGRFELRMLDLSARPAAHRMQRALQIADWERKRPFDLSAEQPIRVTLLALGAESHLMVVNIHHIACDAASTRRIAADLAEFYADGQQSGQFEQADCEIQYADFAAWQLAGKASGAMAGHVDYWRQALDGLSELPLPLDQPRPTHPDWRGGTVGVTIEPATAESVRALAARHRASPYMVVLAAYHAMLAHICESPDVAVGMPVSARTVPELDALVGYFVNTVIVRSRQTGGNTFADLLGQIRERFLDAFDHRAAPFKWVVDEAGLARAAGGNSLFQAGFDMDRAEQAAFRLAGLRVERVPFADSPAAKFDVSLHVETSDQGLVAWLEYAAAIIEPSTAQAWATYFETLLETVVREPGESLAHIHGRLGERNRLPGRTTHTVPDTRAATVDPAAKGRLVDSIRQVWCEVLATDVDPRANFFDVGGDSLRAVALAGRLRAAGLDISATDIFAYQTVADLAEACAGRLGDAAGPVPVEPFEMLSQQDRDALPPDVVDAYPLAAMQLGMIIELRARPGINTYQDSTSFPIRDAGELDIRALGQAAQCVVDRHEVLRTTFDLTSYSVPLQLVHRAAAIEVGVTRHGTLGPAGWMPRIEAHAAIERSALIDMAHAPLIRLHAHTADDSREWWITITEFHPILEGWSFHSMLMQILTAYREIRAGLVPAEPEPVPFRFADYIAAEAAARKSEEDISFWRGVIDGRADAALPSAWQDSRQSPRDRYQQRLNYRDLMPDLRRLASETRTSMKAVILAAHLKVMSMVCGSRDFFTGVVCDARPEVDGAERTLGMYLNTLPFTMPAGARTWGGLVRSVYDELTGMWPHRFFPLQVLQQELGTGGRLLDVFFNYLDFHHVDWELVDGDRALNDNDNEFALHVFTFAGILVINTTNHRLSRPAAARLAGLYRAVLADMALGPDGDAHSACLPAGQGDQGTAGIRPAARCSTVLETFADKVADRPGALAVRCGGESITYEQFDQWAGKIAYRLRQSGVGPGSLVAVTAERHVATPVALLAVWMAGGSWTLVESAESGRYAAVVSATAGDFGDTPVVIATELADSPAAPRISPQPDDVACVASTARTQFSHRALRHALTGMLEALAGTAVPGSSWLCSAPLSSSEAVGELLVPLLCGGSVVMTQSVVPDALDDIAELVASGTLTCARLAPLVAHQVASDGVTVIVGSDSISPAGTSSRSAIEIDGLIGWMAVDGVPLDGLGVRVLDTELDPVPIGVVGELCVSGAGLPDAVHADPAATAERFVPDGRGDPGARLYRTGQLARFTEDGTLQTMGCGDQLSRTSGALDLHPSIVDSYVRVEPDGGRLIGYVRTAAPLDADDVRAFLTEQKLPRRLVPDRLVEVDSWPMTARGTLDPARLHEPPDTTGASSTEQAEWDERFELLLRDALAAASYEGQPTPDLLLADAGMDSFATVGLLLALEQAYGIAIPGDFRVVDMLRTPATLWRAVAELRSDVDDPVGMAQFADMEGSRQ